MSDELPWPIVRQHGFFQNTALGHAVKDGYFLSESQARALYEGAKILLELDRQNILDFHYSAKKVDKLNFDRALALLFEGIGRKG